MINSLSSDSNNGKRRSSFYTETAFRFCIREHIWRRNRHWKSRCSSNTCLVEMGGIEPPSEKYLPWLSPSAVNVLNLPYHGARWQATRLGSSWCVTGVGALPCSHLPLIDARCAAEVLRAGTSSLRC